MAKRGRHRKQKPRAHRPVPPRSTTSSSRPGAEAAEALEPELIRDVRRAMAGPPLDLLAFASTVLAVFDPRGRDPFATPAPEPADLVARRDELVASFIDVERRETTALLAALGALIDDELMRARIRRALAARTHPLPHWLRHLDETVVERTMTMVHVLGDGDNYLLGIRIPPSHGLTVVVYVDHNLGSLVKDAYVVNDAIDAAVEVMRQFAEHDPDTVWADADPADVRRQVVDAIDIASMTVPPFESDTWPASRALVEWVLRLLPDGGRARDRPSWTDTERAALTDHFFASDLGTGLDDALHRELLDTILWFGCDYGPGDPMRWSPVAVEILLVDFVPRKVVAPAAELAHVPELLRAFVAYCHRERGIRAAHTADTLAAIDAWEPEFRQLIRTPRHQGPMALLERMGVLAPGETPAMSPGWDDEDEGDDEEWDYHRSSLEWLGRAVGGVDALMAIDDAPLPDEPFDWAGVPDDVHARVGEVLALCDAACDGLFDHEVRTASRRLLARVARGDASGFRRRARSESAAGAIVWAIAKANDAFTGWAPLVKDLEAFLGLAPSTVSQRAPALLRAAGLPPPAYGRVDLAAPDLLVSRRRRALIQARDRHLD